MSTIVKTFLAAGPCLGAVALFVLLGSVLGSRPLAGQEQPVQEIPGAEETERTEEKEAREYVYRLETEASEVTFALNAFLHKVHGGFAVSEGEVRFDPACGEASGEIIVDATSGDTGNKKRDRDMHRKVLESEAYPRIVLDILGFRGDLSLDVPSEVEVDARLRIHGAEHSLSLPVRLEPMEGGRLRAETSFVVPYVEWGMKNPSTLFLRVAKEVTVTIDVIGTISPATPSPHSD